MISATTIMRPLPVRPIDGTPDVAPDLQQPVRGGDHVMLPLGTDAGAPRDLTGAIKDAAFQRMMNRLGIVHPLPVIDPTA